MHAVNADRTRILGAVLSRLPELKLDQIDDPRSTRGQRHTLQSLLTMAIVGCAAGAKTLRQVEAFGEDLEPVVRRRIGVGRRVADTTLRDVLVRVNPDHLRGALRSGTKARIRGKSIRHDRAPFGVVSVDGKTCTTRLATEPYAQPQRGVTLRGLVRTLTCTLVSSNAFPCLDAVPIPSDTNETGHFPVAFSDLCQYYGRDFELVMGDAAFATATNAALVDANDKAYAFQLKENEPTLLADARALLAWPGVDTIQGEAERDPSGFVARRLRITPVNTTDKNKVAWPSARQVMSIERLRVDDKDNVLEVLGTRHFITNLRPKRATKAQWLTILRDRWAVENQTHGTLDIAFQEDDYPWIEEPQGMVNVFLLRRIAMNILGLFRAVTLRSDDKRRTPWGRLFVLLRDALVTATIAILDAFRRRPSPATQ